MLSSGSQAMNIQQGDRLLIDGAAGATPAAPSSVATDLARKIELYAEGIDRRNLLRQVLLQLHRLPPVELAQENAIDYEVRKQAEKLSSLARDTPKLLRPPDVAAIELRRAWLDLVDPSTAEFIHRAHHYLGSSRGDAIHLGLYHRTEIRREPRLMSLVSLSPFDLLHLADALPSGLRQEQVLVLSRLFAFEWCPRNTISYTLGRVFSWLRERLPHVKMLLTYLNPNLGFNGTVYQATNWTLFGYEMKRRYLYLDSNYVTDRQMIRAHGTADLRKLRALLGERVSGSALPLKPLEIYAYFLNDGLRRKSVGGFKHEFQPATELVGER